jgi:hypothetical protein
MLGRCSTLVAFSLLTLSIAACGGGGGTSASGGDGGGNDDGATTDATQGDAPSPEASSTDGTMPGHDATADGSGSGGSDSGSGSGDATTGDGGGGANDGSADGSSSGGNVDASDGGGSTCPSTCAELGANCGTVSDTKCGGVIQCGSCPVGQTCGGAGQHNVCGMAVEACSPLTCAAQNVNCGSTGDGCGGTLQCGTCTAPKTCGGGSTPGQCGCTGVCASIPTCSGATTTTISGKVMDPAGIHPLYNALVYIPNNPNDPGLQPFPAGITCDVCGTTAAGDPLVSAYTAVDGTFTLTGTPVGASIPLVIQLGHWRRQFTISATNSCGANPIASALTMPQNHTQGDIPRIAILTGGFDPMECVLRKMGVQDSEFTNPGGAGHIQFYLAQQAGAAQYNVDFLGCPYNPLGSGAKINASTPTQTSLFGTTGGSPTINQYDLTVLACEGYEENNQANWNQLGAYTSAGGRVFTTDFAYNWMATSNGNGGTPAAVNPAYSNVATWDLGQNAGGSPETGYVDLVSNPKGMPFDQWLQIVGVSVAGSDAVSINPVFHNSNAVVAPTQQWLYSKTPSQPIHFTFNTPVGAASANQCGRVVFSDWHADNLSLPASFASCGAPTGGAPYYSHNMTFPAECDSNPMTAQEAILEFMLFDLSACVQPYTPLCTPTTCAAQGIQCGPAGDGCGNLLQCGSCATGQTCGGGGAGKCGVGSNCTPETCASQGIQCGPAGDGCGNMLNCGNCATGQVCGGSKPGQCASL